ncbi:hypothetical protein M5W98_30735, partial [Paenibacillus apiarius]|nr:hypothetical protein [Paenibacillus apiarius]
MIDRYNVGLLWGLIWMRTMCQPSEQTLRSLGQIAERAARKISGHGPASPKLANVAVAALVDTDHPAALAQLARLSSRLTYKSTLRLVEKGLARHAEARGISREDVEEMALPGFGLPLADKLGDCSYELEVRGVDAVVVWRNADGKVVNASGPGAQGPRRRGEGAEGDCRRRRGDARRHPRPAGRPAAARPFVDRRAVARAVPGPSAGPYAGPASRLD